MTSTLIPLVGPQALPTLLKPIAIRKGAYPNLIVHSPKHPRRTQGELMDATNPPICQQDTCNSILSALNLRIMENMVFENKKPNHRFR